MKLKDERLLGICEGMIGAFGDILYAIKHGSPQENGEVLYVRTIENVVQLCNINIRNEKEGLKRIRAELAKERPIPESKL